MLKHPTVEDFPIGFIQNKLNYVDLKLKFVIDSSIETIKIQEDGKEYVIHPNSIEKETFEDTLETELNIVLNELEEDEILNYTIDKNFLILALEEKLDELRHGNDIIKEYNKKSIEQSLTTEHIEDCDQILQGIDNTIDELYDLSEKIKQQFTILSTMPF